MSWDIRSFQSELRQLMNMSSHDYYYDPTEEDNMDEPESVRHISMGILGVLSVSGTIGNALVLYVFSHQKQKLSSTIFILTLAANDFITSFVTMPFTIVCEVLHFDIEYDFLCKLFHFLVTTTIPFSAFVMVAIAVDRYLCIVHPFKHTMTIKRAQITACVLCVCAVIIGIINCLSYGVYDKYSLEDLAYIASIAKQNFTQHTHEYRTDYIRYTGRCTRNNVIFDEDFFRILQKMYSSIFGICAVIVITLYIVIYRSVLTRRLRRLHLTNSCRVNCCGFFTFTGAVEQEHEQTEFTVVNTTRDKSPSSANGSTRENRRRSDSLKDGREEPQPSEACNIVIREPNERRSLKIAAPDNAEENDNLMRPSGVSKAKLEKLRMANIKTALMLSIVALTYIVAFAPAWLMALEVIPMNAIVFYLYFTYNVANPIIYAFLNKSFRIHLKALFKMR